MFNIIHLETGFKVDLIIKKKRVFSQEEFAKREEANYLGEPRWFTTAEDVILAKLEWTKLGDSERQFTDALNVARIQGENLDRKYLEKWAGELDLEQQLERLFQDLLGIAFSSAHCQPVLSLPNGCLLPAEQNCGSDFPAAI